MPAETHCVHPDAIDTNTVLELIWALASPPDASSVPDRSTSLGDLDLADEIAKLELWAAAAEELADRTVGEPDLDDLLGATTAGELADAIQRSLVTKDRHT